jgi:trans-aconitate 2-methyltransferase
MLAKARSALPAVTWIRASVAEWEPDGPADVIFSNAALHWLPHHERLFPAIAGRLAPGGVLAIQMPNNFSAPSHTGIADTVHAGPWKTRLLPLLGPSPVASPGEYYQYLSGHVDEIDIWETEYLQVLRGQDPVKEWTKGTWLKRFLDALEGAEAIEFEEQYAARMRVAYPQRADGTTLFPFRRLFIVARRG